jgi:hypothetical protein
VPALLAVPMTLGVMFLLAVAIERVVLRPLVNQPDMVLFMATIGITLFLIGFGEIIFGGEKANDGGRDGGRSECINDTWLIRLRDEFAAPVIAEEGMPPTPRMHHSLSAVDLGNGAFRVVVLGGVRSGSIPRRDDCVHLLHMTADGIARWRSGMHALTASAEAKVKAKPPVVSEMAIRMARRAGNGSDATREATQREEQRVRASMEELCALLERYAHSACVEGKRVILFGGRCAQGTLHVASDALVSFDSETIDAAPLQALGRPPAPRYAHAALLVGSADGLVWPARAMLKCTREGCHAPMHATLRRPRCVLRGKRRTPQRATTPSYPWPLVAARQSIFSPSANTSITLTCFSSLEAAKATLAATSPPLTWISMTCALRWRRPLILSICVCATTRTICAILENNQVRGGFARSFRRPRPAPCHCCHTLTASSQRTHTHTHAHYMQLHLTPRPTTITCRPQRASRCLMCLCPSWAGAPCCPM